CSKCSKEQPKPIVLVEEPEMVNEEINKLIREQFENIDTASFLVIADDTLFATKFIAQIYAQQNFTLLWTDKGNKLPQTDSMLHLLKNVNAYGLIEANYHTKKIDSLIHTQKDSLTKKFDAVKLYEADVLLTNAFLTLMVHVSKGRFNADSLTLEWHPEKMDTTIVELFKYSFQNNNFQSTLKSIEPQDSVYQSLKAALYNYKLEFNDSNWDSLASRESDSLTFKDRLKNRLIASHDYYDNFSGNDSIKLVKAIKNFQCRHNLVEDGKVGKLTFKALQMTKLDYIRQIELNMERCRWTSPPTDKQYVWVNLPKYEMKVIEADTIVMKSRVIVGSPKTPTPLLKSTIRYFIIYPYWTVPFSIATKEILPILKRDTSYLRRKNFEVLDGNNRVIDPSSIQWKKYSVKYFPWKLRQRIGDDNSLGILKFNFNNKYGVYMHDTDNRKLFAREMRALSHGCVRLEKFIDFASFLIRDDSLKYPVDSLKADLLKEQQKYVYVKRPIPVYFNYFTVETSNDYPILFFIDMYRRDEKMLKALYKN
ncbi:MAG: L,D-transpeptidase family protein, partial [Bacteroidia bacterium]|nr:L,D-transpeptidase family protein [Bacteroidia bacterium]